MKKAFLVLVLFFIGFTAVSAQELPSVTIVNKKDKIVTAVYIRQTANEPLGLNRLKDNQTIGKEQSVTLELPFPINKVSSYVITVEYSDGDKTNKTIKVVSANTIIEFSPSNVSQAFLDELC